MSSDVFKIIIKLDGIWSWVLFLMYAYFKKFLISVIWLSFNLTASSINVLSISSFVLKSLFLSYVLLFHNSKPFGRKTKLWICSSHIAEFKSVSWLFFSTQKCNFGMRSRNCTSTCCTFLLFSIKLLHHTAIKPPIIVHTPPMIVDKIDNILHTFLRGLLTSILNLKILLW